MTENKTPLDKRKNLSNGETLSSKREHVYCNRYVYPEKDVKETIQRIKEIVRAKMSKSERLKRINEEVGGDLR